MKDLIFNEDQKVMSLTLEDLQQTADYKGARKHDIAHHELFSQIMTDLGNRGYKAEVDQLFISKGGVDYPNQREVDTRGYLTSVNDIRGVIVRNCVGRINITGDGLSNKESNQQMAISYNKQGIALASGQNIMVCSNLNIYGSQMIQNYGKTQMPFMRMLEIMASWIQNMRKLRTRDLAVLDILKGAKIDPMKEVDEVIGHLHRLSEMNVKNSKIVAPLNHSRINDLQRGILSFEGELDTAYDLYQCATEVATHQSVIENRLANVSDLGAFFQQRYSAVIDVEFDEVIPTALV